MTKKHLFSWLLKKAVSMALWTKASLCVKSSLLEQSLPRTPSRLRIICVNPVILSNFSSCPNVFVAKNPFNQRNPRLMNYLCAYKAPYKALYICRDTFTDVMSALQIKLFMQNKANFRKSQMNVTDLLTKNYEKKDTWVSGKNEPKTNPIEPNFKKAKMNVTSIITKGYENKPPNRAPKKRTQFPLTTKTNANLFAKRDYEKYRAFGSRQNKPNQTQFQSQYNADLHLFAVGSRKDHYVV